MNNKFLLQRKNSKQRKHSKKKGDYTIERKLASTLISLPKQGAV